MINWPGPSSSLLKLLRVRKVKAWHRVICHRRNARREEQESRRCLDCEHHFTDCDCTAVKTAPASKMALKWGKGKYWKVLLSFRNWNVNFSKWNIESETYPYIFSCHFFLRQKGEGTSFQSKSSASDELSEAKWDETFYLQSLIVVTTLKKFSRCFSSALLNWIELIYEESWLFSLVKIMLNLPNPVVKPFKVG